MSGRVLGIGSEGSTGICGISAGRIRFQPITGIVGEREVPVLRILSSEAGVKGTVNLGAGPTVVSAIRTEYGDLYWVLPGAVAADALAMLAGRSTNRGTDTRA